MISFRHKGDFSNITRNLQQTKNAIKMSSLERYGQEGVNALASATPVDSGKTSKSWSYKVEQKNASIRISFYNSNNQNGVPIAIILQYGHATRNGKWVEGRDYINPAIQPIFDRIADDVWEEVTRK